MELFEDALERVRRYLFVVAGYVAMPEHAHLLVNEPRRTLLSKAVQALKLSVSMRSQSRPFWQAHYYDFNISSHKKFVEKLRYIHRNSVRRGLVEKPEDWKWSSFRHYQKGVCGMVEIESEVNSARERLATPRVDVLYFPGPQMRGTGGTLGRMNAHRRPGPPAKHLSIKGGHSAARKQPTCRQNGGSIWQQTPAATRQNRPKRSMTATVEGQGALT